MMILAVGNVNAQSKKHQILSLNQSIDSLRLVLATTRDNSVKDIKHLNITIEGLNANVKEITKEKTTLKSALTISQNSNNRLSIDLGDIQLDLTEANEKHTKIIDSLTAQIIEQQATIDSQKETNIDIENDWNLIKTNLVLNQKDISQTLQWLNNVIKPQNFDASSRKAFESVFTSSCYSYIEDITQFYWGYPGSIEENKLISKWGALFDLNFTSFGHAFENGNCGWATLKVENIDFLGVLNSGDWFKLTIVGGCGDNDYSQTLVRIIKVIDENGAFKIANFLSERDK